MVKGFKRDGKFHPTESKMVGVSSDVLRKKKSNSLSNKYTINIINRKKESVDKENILTPSDEEHLEDKLRRLDDEELNAELKKRGISYDQYLKEKIKFNNFGLEESKAISTQFGRGTFNTGFFNVIDRYNDEHPDNQIDYSNSGLADLDKTISDNDDVVKFDEALLKWNVWIEKPENKPIKEIISKIQDSVDDYNKLTDKKYEDSKVFFRGTSIHELETYIDDGVFATDSDNDFPFISLTMNPSQAYDTFNTGGVVIRYNADEIKKTGGANKVQYTMDFTPVVDMHPDSNLQVDELERTDSKQNALFVDEQEIRLDKRLEPRTSQIKSIEIDTRVMGIDKFLSWLDNEKLISEYKNPTRYQWSSFQTMYQTEMVTGVKERLGHDFADNIRIHISV